MSDVPPPPPDDSGWSSEPPPPPPGQSGPAGAPAAGFAALGTGETVQLATPGGRLGARIIDTLIMGAVVLILFIAGIASAIGLTAEDSTVTDEESAAVTGAFIAFALLAVVIGVLYEVTMIATKGQTLGKMATRIKVVRADNGLVPGWGKAIGRWIIPAALGFIPLVGWILSLLVYLSLLWDKARQGWHDKAAKTFVVKV